MLTHLEHRHDMGMSEMRGGHRLDAEPLHILGPRPRAAKQPLQGHDSPAAEFPGTEDDAHSTLAQLFEELIIAEENGTLGG